MTRSVVARALLVALTWVGVSACGHGPITTTSRITPHAQGATTPSPSPTSAAPRPSQPITKLMVVVVENHSLHEMRRRMPYTARLADRYGYATKFRALTHPSLPNYLAMVGGRRFGVVDDAPPAVHHVHGRSVFGQGLAAGRTAGVYADAMHGTCRRSDGTGDYAVRHNPWTYFVGERALCARRDVPLGKLAGDIRTARLPNAGMVVPNLCHDAHDCTLRASDRWMRRQVGALVSGPDFASGRLAVVLTADEDDHTQGNTVLTAVLHRGLDGLVTRTPLTTYSITRLYDEVLGTPLLGRAARAPSMAKAFGLTL